jgi:hypothetical protein
MSFSDGLMQRFNNSISANLVDRIANGQPVSLVDHYNVMDASTDIGNGGRDNVHPNQDGYKKMAGAWFNGFLDLLGDFGDYTAINDEFYVNAAVTALDEFSFTVSAELVNNSSSARSDLSIRHFVDLTELMDAGYGTGDILIGNISGPTVGDLTLWDADEDVYYVEVDFSGVEIATGGVAEVEFSLGVDSGTVTESSAWNEANDWSTQYLTSSASKTRYLPIFDSNGDMVSGVVPA